VTERRRWNKPAASRCPHGEVVLFRQRAPQLQLGAGNSFCGVSISPLGEGGYLYPGSFVTDADLTGLSPSEVVSTLELPRTWVGPSFEYLSNPRF
jgi:hypothetical protein